MASALQIFAYLDPINQRFQVAIAMFGRLLMVVIYLCLGGVFGGLQPLTRFSL